MRDRARCATRHANRRPVMSIRAERRRSRRFTYEFLDQVKETARGNWPHVLKQCGVHGRFLKNSHGPCPGCGGEDRFRFDDKDGRGTFYCNQRTPPAGDGFDLLRHVHGWTFPETVREVAAALGIREPRSGKDAQVRGGTLRRQRPATLDSPLRTSQRLWTIQTRFSASSESVPVATRSRPMGKFCAICDPADFAALKRICRLTCCSILR